MEGGVDIWGAASKGDLAGVAAALSQGVPVDAQNRAGSTPAHAAARSGSLAVLELLAAKGADLEVGDHNGMLPVHEAARSGHLDAVKLLHSLGCALDVETDAGQSVAGLAKTDAVRKFVAAALKARAGATGAPAAPAPNTKATGGRPKATQPAQQAPRAAETGRQQRRDGSAARHVAPITSSNPTASPSEAQPSRTALDDPIEYAALLECGVLPGGGPARLPRCVPADVGFSAASSALGMPKRPAWRGIVRSAAELHAREEAAFQAWQQRLAASHEPGCVSFYESRLEYWRQLWRVLDLCDVVVMIVDARNPLLHFSEALATHVLRDHRKPLVLVLNKADLVPETALDEWAQWLSARYPGLTSVRACASDGGTSALDILKAVLACTVQRPDGPTKVSELVGQDAADILAASRQRNTRAKRVVATEGGGVQASGPPSSDGDTDHDEGAAWSLKGTKAKKKDALRRKRGGRRVGGGQRGVTTAGPSAVPAGRGAQHHETHDEGPAGSDDESGRHTEGSDGEPAHGDDAADEASDGDNFNHELERFEQEDMAQGEREGDGAHAAPSGAATPASRSARPLVVTVVGEPNVGKSSTMNALLGAHRVAVSSHPGRTKHFQTHLMTPRLMLCDCPGLVFPRLGVPLAMQVLYGSYPIAHCRDPYSVIRYLGAHAWPRLHVVLGLRKEDTEAGPARRDVPNKDPDPDEPWSPLELAEAFAAKKNWRSRKGGRLDVYRAANWILRAALAGREGVCLAWLPPDSKVLHE